MIRRRFPVTCRNWRMSAGLAEGFPPTPSPFEHLAVRREGALMPVVLVVDDAHRTFIRNALYLAGCRVILEAATIEDALIIARTEKLNLIVMDLFLPQSLGRTFIRLMQQQLSDVKIIAMSGQSEFASIDYHRLAMDCGAILTLTKPISQIDLISAVGEALGNP